MLRRSYLQGFQLGRRQFTWLAIDHAERTECLTGRRDERCASIKTDIGVPCDKRIRSKAIILRCVLNRHYFSWIHNRMGTECL